MLDLPVRTRVRHDGPIDMDMMLIGELKELLPSELRAVVRDDRVWDSKMMDNVMEK